jgi:hypothetical protein
MNSTYRQQTFPNVTPSLSAGEHEVRDYYGPSVAQRPSSNENYLTPYLGLQARLSQIWINRWTVLLLLILVRLLFAVGSVNDLIDDARSEALSACTQVENMGSTFASLPHYMSQGVNQLTSDSITKAVSGLHSMVDLTITGVEQIVIFYIGMLTNTYLCLITAAVTGSVSAVVDVVESAKTAVTSSLTDIANDLGNEAATAEAAIQKLASGINTVFGSSLPNIDLTKEINELKNFSFPSATDLDTGLIKLNSSMPTFDQVKNFTDNLISTPFEDLKTLIDTSWGNYTFNSSVFPVPEKNTLTFCSTNNNINTFFDNLKTIAAKAKKVFIAVLLILAIAACIPMAYVEIRRHRFVKYRAQKIQSYAVDSMDAVYLVSRPYSSDFGRIFATRFHSSRRQTLVRWCIAYCTSLPALFLISLALAGFFSCFCQWILLKVITKEVPAITAEIVAFADEVVGQINNSSQKWATDANMVVLNETTKINTDLLGWVQTSTTAVNNTLNGFIDETISLLNTTFGGTPLYTPILDVFNCLIGIKVKGIESGLTWVHDNAQVSFPLLPNNTMTLGDLLSKSNSDASSFLSDPTDATQDGVTAAITKVGDKVLKTIRQEALVSLMLLLAWLIVLLIGIGYILWKSRGQQPVLQPTGTTFLQSPKVDITEMYEQRNRSPAPAYMKSGLVGQQTGFNFNNAPAEEEYDEKHGVTSQDSVFPPANQYQAQPVKYYANPEKPNSNDRSRFSE